MKRRPPISPLRRRPSRNWYQAWLDHPFLPACRSIRRHGRARGLVVLIDATPEEIRAAVARFV